MSVCSFANTDTCMIDPLFLIDQTSALASFFTYRASFWFSFLTDLWTCYCWLPQYCNLVMACMTSSFLNFALSSYCLKWATNAHLLSLLLCVQWFFDMSVVPAELQKQIAIEEILVLTASLPSPPPPSPIWHKYFAFLPFCYLSTEMAGIAEYSGG